MLDTVFYDVRPVFSLYDLVIDNLFICKESHKKYFFSLINRRRYYLGPTYPTIYLTYQEAQCIKHFLSGLNNVQTSQKMGLTPQTISQYSVSMRRKLKCDSKEELMEIIKKTEFIKRLIN